MMWTPLVLKFTIRIAMLLATANALRELAKLNFLKTRVTSLKDKSVFTRRELPNFVCQNVRSRNLQHFKRHLNNFDDGAESLEIATQIREWVHVQQNNRTYDWRAYRNDNESEDPELLLRNLYAGEPTHCRQLAYIMLGALLSADIDARIAAVTEDFSRIGFAHVMVEAWISELSKWVAMDPMSNTTCLVDGKPASIVEVTSLVSLNELNRVGISPPGYTIKYFRHYRQAFIAMTNAVFDGYKVSWLGKRRIHFAHYAQFSSYPQTKKLIWMGVLPSAAIIFIFSFLFK